MTTMIFVLLLTLLYAFQSLFCKLYSKYYPGSSDASSSVFSVVSGLSVTIVALLFGGWAFEPAPLTILMGVINALALIGYNTGMVCASVRGPYSVQMVFMLSGNILIPSMVALTWGERLSVYQWIAVLVIIASIVMVSYKPGEQKVTDKSFYLFCLLLFITNGIYGTLMSAQQRMTGEGDKQEMVILTYFLTAFCSAVYGLIKQKGQFVKSFKQTGKSLTCLLISSLSTALAIQVLVYIIPLINVTILYTFDNSGIMVFSVVTSYIFFKEKLSKLNVIGCVLICIGLIAMVLL